MVDIEIKKNKSIEKNNSKPEASEILDMGVEKELTPEQSPEFGIDTGKRVKEQMQEVNIPTIAPQPIVNPAQVGPSDQKKKIEEILSTDLEEIYLKLPDNKKGEFKKTGEKTAQEINVLLSQTKVKIDKIINLIKKWLKLIPGVNKFFLEQEAKIKADKIIKLRNK